MTWVSAGFAQQTLPQWHNILSDRPETYRTQLISSTERSIQVQVQVPGFYTTNVTTPRGEAKLISMPKAVSTAHAGEPDLPMTGIPVLIGDQARMSIRVLDAQYMDFEGIDVAPSKGDFPRTIDPATVPYTYGECYSQDAFFPASNVGLYEPYIVRDFRGQNMVVYPYAYNPVTRTLRVYYDMTVEMYKVDDNGVNTMETRRSNTIKMSQDFKSLYQRHFINYEAAMNRYTPLDEEGDLLIICYDNFISSMTDFVNWKKTRGINTTIVGTTTAGSTYSAIQTYIKNQYNANNNISHVLLVGDVAQIPGYTYSGGGSSYAGKGDNAYGQIVGSDIYNDVIIGRFSASSAARVTTQCNRAITYERDLTTSASWLQKAEGISRKENGSGHNNEDDYQHMDNIRTDLLNYGYTTVYQRYANLTGYDASSSTISSDINSGVGIINYANHGQETAWGANSSGYVYYANSHVNALTNENKLPFIFSVACLVGKYDHSSDCFAEAWMNATNNNNPTGAIGTLMSYISQPWIPPMWAQDECIDILVESYSNNKKYTYGGISINGLMGIFDHYSTSEQQAVGTYQAWIVYGDPTLMVRTKTPQSMTVTHSGSLPLGNTSYSVTVSNGNGAVATITDASHNILGKATVSNGSATINISGTLTANQELTLCVFGYNKVTYLGTITVTGGTQYTITANAGTGGTVTGGGSYYENTQCTLIATPATGYTFTNWKKDNNVVSTSATYTFTVTSITAGTYTATFTAIPQYTIAVQANPTAGGSVSGGGTFYSGTSCTLTATANTHYEFVNWTKSGTQVSTNASYTFTVTANGTYVANFNALTAHTVTCNATENGTISASPTTAYKGETVTLTATPASGFYFGAWTVKDANNNPVQVSNNQFTMPDSNVTVSATFVTGYNVTLASVTNGSISANPTYGPAGTTVTLTATPASGYSLDSWIVYRTDDMSTTVTVSGNSFTMPSYDVTVAAVFAMPQSGDVTVGSGTSTSQYLPTYVWFNYSLSQQIYTQAEVGVAGNITAISFYWYGQSGSNTSSGARSLNIYMSHTNNSNLSSAWIQESASHLVYSGTQTFNTVGWHTITLDTPFAYDGTSNLLLTVDDNTGSYTVNAKHYFRTYSTGAERARTYCSDDDNPDPTGVVSSTYSSSSSLYNLTLEYNAQIQIAKEIAGSGVSLSVSPTALSGFTYPEGEGPSGAQTVDVIGRNLQSVVTVTAPTHYEVSNTANGTYSSTLSLTPANGNVQTLVYVRLKSDLAQGNYNNETLTLTSGAASQNVTLSGTVTEGVGTYYNITVTADPETGGTVTGAGRYEEGTQVTLAATPATGYSFVNWTKGSTTVSTNTTISFNATENAAYVAHFSRNSYTIQATANPTEGGTVTGAGSYYEGTSATLTATANAGYTFVNWTSNGNVVSTEPSYTFEVTAAGSYVANFEEVQSHTVTVSQAEGGTIFANPTTAYAGDVVTLTVNADEGYFFVEWNVMDANSQPVTVNADNTFTMPDSDVTVTAVFTQGFVVTVVQTDHGTISADQTTALQPGDIVTLTSTPDTDCMLLAWYVYKTGDPRSVIAVVNDSYFVMPASDVTVMAVFVTTEQYEAQLGSGTSTNNYIPTYVRANYSLTQQIYLASELDNKKGNITKIAFRATTASATRNLIIYMAHTDKSAFSSTTDWEVMGSVAKVFEGSVTFGTSDWTTITLDTPFEYDGESNLNLCVVDNTGSTSGSNFSYTKFYRYSASNRALYVNGSSSYASTVGYTSLSNTTGTRISYVNRINITMTLPGSAESLTISPDALDGFNYEEGHGPSDMRKLGVVGVDLKNDVTVTAPTNFEISLYKDGTYASSLTIPRESSKGRNVTTWGFEGTLDGWTTVDKDGDGYNWVLGSASVGVYLGDSDQMTAAHNSSTDQMVSGSWTNATTSKGQALNPDNWLISPQVELGGSFSLWAQPYRANYPAEHFGIFVSTTDTNPNSFTMVNEWTLSASTWKQFSVDLSAYAGMNGYIAVRHFGMENNDQFLIKVDDFELDTDASITIDMPVTITPATVFVRMKDNLAVGSYSGTLTASAGTGDNLNGEVSLSGQVLPATAAQTMNLVEGWNWWVPTIETTVEKVQEALGRNLQLILSQDGEAAGTLYPGKMYKIKVGAACDAEVSGYVPTTVSVTVNNGFSWIGYTGTQATDIGTALSGLNPVDGDLIISFDQGFARYENGAWTGTLTTLQPGQGYEYLSNANGSKTVTF